MILNEFKDQESIQSSTTPDPGYQWESDKLTVRHHKREPRGHMAQINRRAQRHNKHKTEKHKQKKYSIGTVSKNILLQSLNQFYGANLAFNSDVDRLH